MKKLLLSSIFVLLCAVVNAQQIQIEHNKANKQIIDSTLINSMLTYSDSNLSAEIDTTAVASKKKPNIFVRFYQYFQQANIDKSYKKKLDISVVGGPHYAKETGFSIGIMSAGIYRTDYTDPLMQPSTISIYGDISTTGFYLLGVRGNHHFPGRKHRIDYSTYFFSFPSAFWGLGYNNGKFTVPGMYTRANYYGKVEYLYSIRPALKVGASLSAAYVKGTKWSDPKYTEDGVKITKGAKELLEELPDARTSYPTVGAGFSIMYDSRDFIPNPTRGIHAKVDQKFYPKFLGNTRNSDFISTELFFNFYQKLWKGCILAYDFHALFTYGNTPWTQYFTTGGSYRMRGYYESQFKDKSGFETQVELRQNIWRRIGIVVWGGFGNVFPSVTEMKWKESLPNWGVGLRWEFKNRINIRLDYGWGMTTYPTDLNGVQYPNRSSAFIFNINEAF